MLKVSVFLIFVLPYVLGSSTVERSARVVDHDVYFTELMQKAINEWERRGFCNLRIDEFTRPINASMYSWQVVGNVTYTNAFLVSIQKLEINTISQVVARRTVDGVQIPFASVRGTLHLRDSVFGYDVIFDQLDEGTHRFTGTFGYTTISVIFEIAKNLRTKELSTAVTMGGLSGGFTRMVYMPANNITEVLSREFSPVTTSASIRNWATDTMAPIMLEIAQTQLDFPKICYSNMC